MFFKKTPTQTPPNPIGFPTKNNALQRASTSERAGRAAARSWEKYRPKTFTEAFAALYGFAGNIAPLFHALSIFLALIFVAYLIAPTVAGAPLPEIWANATGSEKVEKLTLLAAAGLFILGLLEILKAKALSHSFYALFAGYSVVFVSSLIVGLIATGASIYSSVYGGNFAGEVTSEVPKTELVNDMELNKLYDQKRKDINDRIKEVNDRLKKRDSWPDRNKTIPALMRELDRVEKDRQTALMSASTSNAAKTGKAIATGLLSGKVFGFIAGFNEFVIICLLLFREYYEHTSSRESKAGLITLMQEDGTPLTAVYTSPYPTGIHAQANGKNAVNASSVPQFQTATVVKNGYQIKCKNCGSPAIKKYPTAKFCSTTCKNEYHNRKTP